jgi:precorrin-6A/cobalt-precorrin-6A reductase
VSKVAPSRRRLLILGGTGEAAELAEVAVGLGPFEVITSLAGRTRAPRRMAGEVRVGGFGGVAGLGAFLEQHAIECVVDATHPFAVQMGRHAEAACRALQIPRLRLLRPPWRPTPGDRWIMVPDLAAAAARLPGLGRRVLLTVGHRELMAFAGLDALWFLVRTIEPPAALPRQALWLSARGPFRLEDELVLLRTHRIDALVTKASGGDATYAKLAAARALGLPVLMVERPPPPPGPLVETVTDALAWLTEPTSPTSLGAARGDGPTHKAGSRRGVPARALARPGSAPSG